MKEELYAPHSNQTWEIVDLPLGKEADANGSIK